MIPCLYESSEQEFKTNGIGKLADCISCIVTEKRNGEYELSMEYPAEGVHAEELIDRNIILAKPADDAETQPFRIYSVITNLNGTLAVSARHISYELNFITASSVQGNSCVTALESLKYAATTNCDFDFSTDIDSSADMNIEVPNSLRNIMGGIEGSILDTYGGEFEWDRYDVILHKARGSDRGVRISYGKNLEEFSMEEDSGETFTGVHPYWKGQIDVDEEVTDVTVELPEKIIMAEGATDYRIKVLDCSNEFEDMPSEDELRSYAKSYLNTSENTVPKIEITVGYEDISDETVALCDTVCVYVSKLGIEISMKVTETEYDSLLERYNSITLSNSLSSKSALTAALSGYAEALVNTKLSYYVTTKELSTRLQISEGEILTEISEVYATYAQLVEFADTIEGDTDIKLKNYYTIEETQSYVKQNVDSIQSVVSQVTTRVETLEDTAANLNDSITTVKEQYTEITQTIDGINISVSSLEKTVGENYTELSSRITANADAITAEVTRATGAEPKYGTCSTAAGTAAKVVSCSSFSTLSSGATICVYFTYANTASSPTLNVNSTGAKSIYAYGAVLSSGSDYNWSAKSYVTFVYNGSQWCMSDAGANSKIATLSLGITELEGDIISYINASADVINLSGNRIIISSTYFSLSANGTVTATNVDISGTLTTTSGSFTTRLKGGKLAVYYNDEQYGVINSCYWSGTSTMGMGMYGANDCEFICLGFDDDTSTGRWNASYVINFGLNPSDYTERHILYGATRITGALTTGSSITSSGTITSGSTITSAGNITIGTDSDTSQRQLQIINKYGQLRTVVDSSGAMGLYNSTKGHWLIYNNTSDVLNMYTGSGTRRVPDYRCGSTSITPSAANTPTSVTYTFGTAMAGTPIVLASAGTTVIGTRVLGVAASSVSSSSFMLWLTRTNTTATTVYWLAFYGS